MALEVTLGVGSVTIYRCRAPRCGFVGDCLELYSAARKLDLETAIYELVSAGVITGGADLPKDIRSYIEEYTGKQYRLDAWWKESNARFVAGDTHAAGILQKRGCWQGLTTTMGPEGLGPYLGVRRGSEIKDFLGDLERLYMIQDWRY